MRDAKTQRGDEQQGQTAGGFHGESPRKAVMFLNALASSIFYELLNFSKR
jgi:hypothetical protein